MKNSQELLLVLSASPPPSAHSGRYRVTQKVSPRVMLIEPADDATREELEAADGVAAVVTPGGSLDAAVRETLTEIESLFVGAYAQRSRPKERPGEGLDWDAEGFLPPDPPAKR